MITDCVDKSNAIGQANGAAILIDSTPGIELTMFEGSRITNCESQSMWGLAPAGDNSIDLASKSTDTFSGIISLNRTNGTFDMQGGEITGNTIGLAAKTYAVFIASTATMTMSGTSSISENNQNGATDPIAFTASYNRFTV